MFFSFQPQFIPPVAYFPEKWQSLPEQLVWALSETIWSSSSSNSCSNPQFPFSASAYCSCAVDHVLHEEEEEVVKSGEQPQLLEQRHHHGLLQQTRCGAAQRDTHSGERGTNYWHSVSFSTQHRMLKWLDIWVGLNVSRSVSRMLLMSMERTRGSMSNLLRQQSPVACWRALEHDTVLLWFIGMLSLQGDVKSTPK